MTNAADTQVARHRELHVQQLMGQCRHFNGIDKDACAAGVRYAVVRVDHAPLGEAGIGATRSWPCIAAYNRGGATCDKRETLTRAEAEQQHDESERRTALTLAALALIQEQTANRTGVYGHVDCPACGKKLRYSIAGRRPGAARIRVPPLPGRAAAFACTNSSRSTSTRGGTSGTRLSHSAP